MRHRTAQVFNEFVQEAAFARSGEVIANVAVIKAAAINMPDIDFNIIESGFGKARGELNAANRI